MDFYNVQNCNALGPEFRAGRPLSEEKLREITCNRAEKDQGQSQELFMLLLAEYVVSFAPARAGVTQRSPSHAAASNRHTFLSRNKPITVRLSFSCGGSRQKCPPITWLLLFAK